MKKNKQTKSAGKIEDLAKNTTDAAGQFLTTNQGLRVNDDQNSLKAGERGATLLEDFILREKITHFDHERIPERIVHARGFGAEFVTSETFVKRAGEDSAVILGEGIARKFIQAIAQHRNWDRENARKVPA